ncbi:energy-coupling factor transporter transmembrane protein EcfT [Neorhizobium galegae]|uniref:energy-coupling factor transporter transmembrane component T family protein n=1 Tax=Neorhizobium galegae TaxID=399 RepID=UPI00127B52D0|nr:energy-coupling factor transporter transmembrane protein EcfT [Neorhizobium galegae]KAA9386151.1 energy-coupling factor transporter transmembrane protein EcfT [Neorhizobium galegae]KAB1113406.1 energy-coupling factor transporter transmembrane protein EcfT [Neorhizobium galegae]MCM2496363.1 energy-coupling factor transporter transmembrane protein EcfT [Neorhizobium galegae]MCQ1770501.1 energy-coupling factor transporter transmembrane protein EcfT [Neorhizobium galegae]MCQ1799993.1 energy-cou
MKTLYVEGDTFLHRLSPRAKLLGLAVTSLLLFLIHSPAILSVAAMFGCIVYASLRLGWRQSWLRLRPILLTIAVVALFTLVLNGQHDALVVVTRLTALALLAAAVTATTSTGDFIDEITRLAMPLERLGLVRAADIGLSIGLVIRFVPEILSRYQAIRDAHSARGLKVRPLTLAVPLIILTLKNADEIAAAIDARGIRAQK